MADLTQDQIDEKRRQMDALCKQFFELEELRKGEEAFWRYYVDTKKLSQQREELLAECRKYLTHVCIGSAVVDYIPDALKVRDRRLFSKIGLMFFALAFSSIHFIIGPTHASYDRLREFCPEYYSDRNLEQYINASFSKKYFYTKGASYIACAAIIMISIMQPAWIFASPITLTLCSLIVGLFVACNIIENIYYGVRAQQAVPKLEVVAPALSSVESQLKKTPFYESPEAVQDDLDKLSPQMEELQAELPRSQIKFAGKEGHDTRVYRPAARQSVNGFFGDGGRDVSVQMNDDEFALLVSMQA
jgi:hypothetical protein